MNGLILFSKYAIAPSILSYCGPKNNRVFVDIFTEYMTCGRAEEYLLEELRKECLNFNAAVPYLKIIAKINNIHDIFDERVVETYWLGTPLLVNVSGEGMYKSIEGRFKKDMPAKKWALIENSEFLKKAHPFHTFHVLNIFSKIDPLFLRNSGEVLDSINNCVINFGKIKGAVLQQKNSNFLTVLIEYSPLMFDESGNLKFGNKITRDFYSFEDKFNIGDYVSLHWGYVCDKISHYQKINLKHWNDYYIKLFNSNQI